MSKYVVIDLDGTLCDHTHRKHLALTAQWSEYHGRCIYDPPNKDVLQYVMMLAAADSKVMFLTGRPNSFRGITDLWLAKHLGDQYEYSLMMRPIGDTHSDYILKLSLLECYFGDERGDVVNNVLHAIDDRPTVVNAFREYGINCWQARPGRY